MKCELPKFVFLATLMVMLWTADGYGVSVTDYRTYRDTTATTLANQGTDDPIIGDLSHTANSSFLIGYLPSPATLPDAVGSSVTLTFGVSFNDGSGMANAGDNFRFALFDLNGEAQDSGVNPNYATAGTANTDDYRGYWLGVRNGSGTGSGGSIRERIGTLISGQNAFAATGANLPTAPSLGPVGGTAVTLTSDVNGNGAGAHYTGKLRLLRNVAGLVDVSGSFIGTNGATGNLFSAPDNSANASYSYGAVGFLIGNALNLDQAIFTDVTVTTIDSPAGDYNGNGVVDAADYVLWRKLQGTTGGASYLADSEPDGDVDNDDYIYWQSRFGNAGSISGNGSSLGQSNVPEPTGIVLAAMAAAVTLAAAGRRRRLSLEPVRVMRS